MVMDGWPTKYLKGYTKKFPSYAGQINTWTLNEDNIMENNDPNRLSP